MNRITIPFALLVAAFAVLPCTLHGQAEPGTMPELQSPRPANGSGTNNPTMPGMTRSNPGPYSQDTSANNSGGTDSGAMRDKMFLRKAAQGGMAEIRLGTLATEKADGDDVKKFGQKMVDDHTRMNEEMKPFADALGVLAPKGLSKIDQAEYDKLNGLSGADFDREYLTYMTNDHHKDLSEFRQEAASTSDAALKEVVLKGHRVIAMHTRMVERLDTAHGVTPK